MRAYIFLYILHLQCVWRVWFALYLFQLTKLAIINYHAAIVVGG